MHPTPEHFIARPGAEDGKPGPIVPLIAVDQLPDWIQLADIPRVLTTEQIIGMTNLGIIDKKDVDVYEVRLHHGMIRAILNGSPGMEDEAKNINKSSSLPPRIETKTNPERKKTITLAPADSVSLLGPNVNAQKQTSASPHGGEHRATEPGITGVPNSASIQEGSATVEGRQVLYQAEPMLNASRHNAVQSNIETRAQSETLTRMHMTETMRDTPHPTTVQRGSRIKNKLQANNSNPDTVYCRYWCHHGTCKWGWNCRYQHRMPMTFEGLREVGLKGFPTWYRLMIGVENRFPSLSAGSGLDCNVPVQRLDMGSPRVAIAAQHPSPMELGLMKGRMSSMLTSSGVINQRQELGQVREVRDNLTRASRARTHQTYANPHTDASVAAIPQQAEWQQQHMPDLPVATRTAVRIGAAVDGMNSQVYKLELEDSVGRDERDSVSSYVEEAGHGGNEDGSWPPEGSPAPELEEKLVDI